MKAVVLRELGQPTTVEKLALRPLNRHEVRVRLAASGVCHSDLSLRNGSIPPLLPCTLGHEGAGVVTEVGDDVTNVAPGQHDVLTRGDVGDVIAHLGDYSGALVTERARQHRRDGTVAQRQVAVAHAAGGQSDPDFVAIERP